MKLSNSSKKSWVERKSNSLPVATPYITASALLTLLSVIAPNNKANGQNVMAPDHECIVTQYEQYVSLHGEIAPGDTVCFAISGLWGAGLSISDANEITLRRMEYNSYVGWPIAVSSNPWDTLVIIWNVWSTGWQAITYWDFDCSPDEWTINLVLPIKLISFDAYAEKDSLVFAWKTAQEYNVDEYQGQVSSNAIWSDFKTVVRKDAEADNNEIRNHRMKVSLKDAQLFPGHTYYARLQNHDIDGQIDNSPLVSFKVDKDGQAYEVELLPNPVSSKWKIGLRNLDIDNVKVAYLWNVNGSIVAPLTFDNELPEIDLAKYNLPAGVYVFTAISHDGKSLVNKKVVIGD